MVNLQGAKLNRIRDSVRKDFLQVDNQRQILCLKPTSETNGKFMQVGFRLRLPRNVLWQDYSMQLRTNSIIKNEQILLIKELKKKAKRKKEITKETFLRIIEEFKSNSEIIILVNSRLECKRIENLLDEEVEILENLYCVRARLREKNINIIISVLNREESEEIFVYSKKDVTMHYKSFDGSRLDVSFLDNENYQEIITTVRTLVDIKVKGKIFAFKI